MATQLPIEVRPPEVLRNDPEYIAYLEQRIRILESRSPRTALLSQSFLTRAFAVLGHYLVAGLLLELVALAVVAVFSGLVAVLQNLPH